jgi:hypothetical protein
MIDVNFTYEIMEDAMPFWRWFRVAFTRPTVIAMSIIFVFVILFIINFVPGFELLKIFFPIFW